MKKVNYKTLNLNKYGIPTAQSLSLLMLSTASSKTFWASRPLKLTCVKRLNIPEKLKILTFRSGTHPGVNRLMYNLSWTLHNLYYSGALSQLSYAKYQVTKLGNSALKNCNNYNELNSFLSQHKPKSSKQVKSARHKNVQIGNIYERINNDVHALNTKLKEQLMKLILNKNPYFFEKLVVILLAKMGYKGTHGLARQTQKSRDGGIDGVISKDPLGTSTVYIQAKRYRKSDKVNKNDIKNFCISVRDRHSFRGVFITTSSFNNGAEREAKRHSIVLIDGNKLTNLMIQYNVGTQIHKIYKIDDVDKDFFS